MCSPALEPCGTPAAGPQRLKRTEVMDPAASGSRQEKPRASSTVSRVVGQTYWHFSPGGGVQCETVKRDSLTGRQPKETMAGSSEISI